jgi:PAS domain S-box-containing protein
MSKYYGKFTANRYIWAILIILVLGVLGRSYYDSHRAKAILNQDVGELNSAVRALVEDYRLDLNIKYISVASHFQTSQTFQTLIKARNAKELYSTVKPEYDRLKSLDADLAVMSFFDVNNTTILMMDRPELYGDDLTKIRPMLNQANRDKEVQTGVEIGKSGITYRVTIPLIGLTNEHIGVVEYGIKPSFLYDELEKYMNTKSQLLVKTKNLKALMNKKEFERLGEYSIVDSAPIFKTINSRLDLKKNYQIIYIRDKTYVAFNDTSLNFDKDDNTSIVVMLKDVTYLVNKYNESLYFIYGVNLFILLIIYLLFNRYNNGKKSLQNSLEDKVAEQVEDIKRSDKTLETIFETAKNGIAILDLDSKFVLVNNAYSSLSGYTKEELYSRTCLSITAPEMVDDAHEALAKVLDKGFYGSYEKSCIAKDGKIIEVVMDIALMPDKKSLLVLTKDVTLKNKYKIERKKQEELMFQQSRMAQMGEMISMIAHQWRQPLGAISSTSIDLSLQIEFENFDLKEEEGRERCQAYFANGLKEIDGFVKNLTSTIDDFRNFYKPNKEADLAGLYEPINKALGIIRASFASDGIELVESCESHSKVKLYNNEIMQVILNILKNAQDNFKEKPIDNPKIFISSKDEGDEVVLEISDNGGGIPEDILPKIFDPYFSTKDEKNGTGLGLYMSKTIVEEHHDGRLEARNEGDGVLFTIRLSKELKQC